MDQIPICDTHAHYDDEAFDPDREALLREGLREGGVDFAVNVGASMRGADASVEYAGRYDVIYAGCGIHPDDVGVFEHAGYVLPGEPEAGSDSEENLFERRRREEWTRFSCSDEAMSHLEKLCRSPKVVCVGEIGLDYHWMVEEKEVQQRWFRDPGDRGPETLVPRADAPGLRTGTSHQRPQQERRPGYI